MKYISHKAEAKKAIMFSVKEALEAAGSILSDSISKKAQANIYQHSIPDWYHYTRSHQLAQKIGWKLNRLSSVSIFSSVVYAQYLERLVGKRWHTHWQELDIKEEINKMVLPTGRPYSSFVVGVITGMKRLKNYLHKKGYKIRWRM